MKNNSNPKFRQNSYDANDSGIMFLLALVIPQVLFALVIICAGDSLKTDSFAYTLLCSLVPQIAMILSFLFVSERKKVNYKTANQISFKKVKIIPLLIVLAVGIVAMFGFSPIISLFDHIVEGWGYTSSTSNIDVSTFGKFAGAVVYIAILPAICEELVFRGVITNGLKSYGTKTAVILSAVMFAIMHQNLQQLIYQMFLGAVMAYIILKTGSIIYTMLLHFFNNFVIIFNSYLSGGKETVVDYSNAWNCIWPVLLVIAAVAVIAGLLWLLDFVLKKQNKLCAKSEENSNQDVEDANDLAPKIEKDIQLQSQSEQEGKNESKPDTPVLQNPYIITALVAGVVFWIFSVLNSFGVL
jgi:membrane protease YdiL (CAAX protease family)